jgi:hypothetical protein
VGGDVEGNLAGDFGRFDFVAVEGEEILEIDARVFEFADEVEGLDEGIVIDFQDVVVEEEARMAGRA